MRILFFHNAYQQRGGEDLVVESEIALLRNAGHEVELVTVSNDQIDGAWRKVQVLWQTAYNPRSASLARAEIARFRPDVVHIHNFFPLLTPAIHEVAAQAGCGVVQTLHNYRLLCAAATFERDGHVCEDCLTHNRGHAIAHRCYRGSLPATAALVHMQRRETRAGRIARYSDRIICLTEFARDKFVQNGWPSEKLVVKPNFLDRSAGDVCAGARAGALFVGRLSSEKGVQILLDAWRQFGSTHPLRIAGDGPLAGQLQASAGDNVTFLGRLDAAQVQDEMRRAALLVVPSLWYEGFPMIIVEAFSCGLPVAASGHGSLAQIIEPGRNGAHFKPADAADLAQTCQALLADPARLAAMGATARADFSALYAADRNLVLLENIYRDAIAHAAGHHDIAQSCQQKT